MKNMIKRLRNERGLTLVELLAVIVILAIVAVIAFVFIGGIIENSKKDAHIANAQQAIAAAKLHEATGGEVESITFEELQTGNYLEDSILDPWSKGDYDKEMMKSAKVTKKEEVFTVTGFNGEGCKITEQSEANLSKNDRDEICDNES